MNIYVHACCKPISTLNLKPVFRWSRLFWHGDAGYAATATAASASRSVERARALLARCYASFHPATAVGTPKSARHADPPAAAPCQLGPGYHCWGRAPSTHAQVSPISVQKWPSQFKKLRVCAVYILVSLNCLLISKFNKVIFGCTYVTFAILLQRNIITLTIDKL